MGADQTIAPVVGLIACKLWVAVVAVCSPPPTPAKSTPLATIAEVVQPFFMTQQVTKLGLPALSTTYCIPAMPLSPGTKSQMLPSFGLTHEAPLERINPPCGALIMLSCPPRLPGPPLPLKLARL